MWHMDAPSVDPLCFFVQSITATFCKVLTCMAWLIQIPLEPDRLFFSLLNGVVTTPILRKEKK